MTTAQLVQTSAAAIVAQVAAATTATPTVASIHNAKFCNTTSHFIGLDQRIADTVAKMPARAQANWTSNLKKAIATFKKNHPTVSDFANRSTFPLCNATEVKLADIYIDTTMQREPDLNWVLKIITNFRAYQAQPMQLFVRNSSTWGAWDSQHTALALYLIAKHAFNIDLSTITVPGVIFDVKSRADLRNLFINMNSTHGKNAGKKALDIIDIFEQMIYGVEVDNVTDPEWVAAHAKWQYLSAAGLFLTAEKFNNTEQSGAISRLNEINEASTEVVRQFAVYGKYVVETQDLPGLPRYINTKEIPIIVEFLNLCEQNQITYSDAEIEDLAQHCIDLFDANFDAKGPYWKNVHQANMNAYNKSLVGIPKISWPSPPANNKNTPTGLSFFWHQLAKSWVPTKPAGFKFPKQPFNVFVPSNQDLF